MAAAIANPLETMELGALAAPPPMPEVAKEAPSKEETNKDFGPRNEELPEAMRNALRDLRRQLVENDEYARRSEIRKLFLRRLFWRGEQYNWWSERQGLYYPPYERPLSTTEDDEAEPAFQHVTNLFQAFGLSIQSVLTQNMVPASFFPQSLEQPEDVATAKNALKVVEVVHRNNRPRTKARDAAYYLWVDGFIGGHVRYVSDGEQFGYDEEPVMAEQMAEVAPERDFCEACQMEFEAGGSEWGVCPQCGGELQTLPAEQAPVPMPTGEVERIARGREVVEIVPALNLRRSMRANSQAEFLYLDKIDDVHRAVMIAQYPHLEAKMHANEGGSGPGDAYETTVRRALYEGTTRGGGISTDLGAKGTCWIRPAAFTLVADKMVRAQLLETFPNGVRVVFYGDLYCESRNQSMDKCWRTMHAMPGEGQVRESLGSSMIAAQEQFNDLVNLFFEIFMYGVPEGFADQGLLDFEARRKQGALPGNMSPVDLPGNQDIRQKVFFSQAVEPSSAAFQYMEMLLGRISEFLTGGFPALSGGDTGSNDTLGGIAIQRDQAMGRIGMVWREMQQFWAELDLLGVECFAANRSKDVELVIGKSPDFKSEWIRLQDLQGNMSVEVETDQQFPILQSQLRATLMNTGEDPAIQALMMIPENLSMKMKVLGITDVVIPGEDSRVKQAREIEQLLKEQPQVAVGEQGEPIYLPSIMPEPDLDNHQVEAEAGRKWANSEAGQSARIENPAGFENVKAHVKAHEQIAMMKEMQQAIAAKGVEGQGPAADLGGTQDEQPEESSTEKT